MSKNWPENSIILGFRISDFFLFLLVFFSTTRLAAAPFEIETETNEITNHTLKPPIPDQALEIIRGWREFTLGQDREAVGVLLDKEYLWLVPEKPIEPDIIEKNPERSISIKKNDYFDHLRFQFNEENKLYLIDMNFSRRFFGFNQLYKKLREKYGPPQKVRFRQVTWERESQRIVLRRNNNLKYIATLSLPPAPPVTNEIKSEMISDILDGL